LTVIGPPGVGKSRLACEVAATVSGLYADGAWCVELGELASAHAAADAVKDALGFASTPTLGVASQTRTNHALIVLDDCDNHLDACASLATMLLERCPRLGIIATSRERLAVDGEIVYRLEPLAQPHGTWALTPSALLSSDAIRLYTDRVTGVNPNFALDEELALAVTTLCRALDGLPLAIELAAGRYADLGVHGVVQSLRMDVRELRSDALDVRPRHRSFAAALTTSLDLLSADESTVFRQLAVLAGDWTRDTAASVCSGPSRVDVQRTLDRLIERSLIAVVERGPPNRLRLLEPIRRYALSMRRGQEVTQAQAV
jgi:predicted ATPase